LQTMSVTLNNALQKDVVETLAVTADDAWQEVVVKTFATNVTATVNNAS